MYIFFILRFGIHNHQFSTSLSKIGLTFWLSGEPRSITMYSAGHLLKLNRDDSAVSVKFSSIIHASHCVFTTKPQSGVLVSFRSGYVFSTRIKISLNKKSLTKKSEAVLVVKLPHKESTCMVHEYKLNLAGRRKSMSWFCVYSVHVNCDFANRLWREACAADNVWFLEIC